MYLPKEQSCNWAILVWLSAQEQLHHAHKQSNNNSESVYSHPNSEDLCFNKSEIMQGCEKFFFKILLKIDRIDRIDVKLFFFI